MAGKSSPQYVCNECGAEHARWAGQCTQCNAWNTIQEVRGTAPARKRAGGKAHWAGGTASGRVTPLKDAKGGQTAQRRTTGIQEFDRALGGGLVQGSVVLLGGDPGIGKSTLLLQVMALMSHAQVKALYVTGEESLGQVEQRAVRLALPIDALPALAENRLEAILESLNEHEPEVVVIDSIQTIQSETLESAAGSVSQVRECAAQLTRYAKERGCAVFLVGHVTKSGEVAGPRVLEHLVDAVLFFEGDPQSPYRLVRALKNRFGAVNELGAFEMTEQGLISVDNPSALFLATDRTSRAGSCVFVLQEGPRPLLIEIQALMDESTANNPRRLAVGVDGNRLAMLLAVLHKHGHLDVGSYDVFVNAVGGIKANEPAADLPTLLCLISSLRDKALPAHMACFGEVGLTGEVRPVQSSLDRIREAAKLGFQRILIPQRNLPTQAVPGIEIVGVSQLSEAISQIQQWER